MRGIGGVFILVGLLCSPPVFGQSTSTWWSSFEDPKLEACIERAIEQNQDLNALRAQGKQASALVFQQATGSLPQVALSANANLSPTESLGFGMGFQIPQSEETPKSFSTGQAALNVTMNVDLFGQNGSLIYAADRDARAMSAEIQNQTHRITGAVAGAYWDVIVSQQSLALAEAQLKTQVELLDILNLRFAATEVSALDVLQQKQQVASARVQIPQRRLQVQQAEQRLAVLLGYPPSETIDIADMLPKVRSTVSETEVVASIRQRPDIQAMTRRVQAAKARQWSAWASALPQVGVSARTGVQFFDQAEFNSQSIWGAGATVTLPLFSGGRTYGAIRRARAGVLEAEARLNSAELNARDQVLMAYARDREQTELLRAYESQFEAAQNAWDLAKDHVSKGLTTYLNAQIILVRLQQAEISYLLGQREALAARVALIQSLGGTTPLEETQ